MKFYLFPKYMEEAAPSGWIVRTLKALGDLHALRVQTEAYVAFETDEIKMGR